MLKRSKFSCKLFVTVDDLMESRRFWVRIPRINKKVLTVDDEHRRLRRHRRSDAVLGLANDFSGVQASNRLHRDDRRVVDHLHEKMFKHCSQLLILKSKTVTSSKTSDSTNK